MLGMHAVRYAMLYAMLCHVLHTWIAESAVLLCTVLRCVPCCGMLCLAMLCMSGTAQQRIAQHGTSWRHSMPAMPCHAIAFHTMLYISGSTGNYIYYLLWWVRNRRTFCLKMFHFAQKVYRIYATTSQYLSSYGCTITMVYMYIYMTAMLFNLLEYIIL